jgi:hypothetical protein
MDFEELKSRGLLAEIEAAFTDEKLSRLTLEHIGYPIARLPAFGPGFWLRVCEDIARGGSHATLDLLLAAAARQFPDRPAFARAPSGPSSVASPVAAPQPSPMPQSSPLPVPTSAVWDGSALHAGDSKLSSGLAKVLLSPFVAVGGLFGWVFKARPAAQPKPRPRAPDPPRPAARGSEPPVMRGGLGGSDGLPGTGACEAPAAVAYLDDEDPAHAAAAPGPEPTATGTLFWNIGFPDNDAVFASRVIIAGTVYALETALQAARDAHSFSLAAVAAKDLLGDAADVPVKFAIGARGARIRRRIDDAGAASDWGSSVASDGLTCGAMGTDAFRVEILADAGGPVSITIALQVRGAIALRETIALHAVAIPGEQVAAIATAEPAPEAVEIAAAAIQAVPEAMLVLQLEPSERWYGLKLTAGGVEDTATLHTCATTVELAKEAVLARKKLVALSKRYRAEPAGDDDPFAGLRPTDRGEALLEVARIGRRLHALLFGEPEDNVPLDLARIAELIRGHGQHAQVAPRMQIDAETLPFPWGIVYDATGPLDSVADVALRGFWGRRFAIDRTISAILRSLPPPTLDGAIQPCLNPHLDREENLGVVARQRGFWKRIERSKQVRPAIESGEQLRAYLKDEGSAAPAILYFFCHARAAHEMNDQLFQIAAAADEQASLLLDPSGSQGELSIGELRRLRKSPLKARPLVFLNACSSAEADQYYQSQFLTLFVSQWQARAFIGSDWKIPTEFADAFARRALDRFLARDPEAPALALGAALHATAVEVLELDNPFPLIYALYGRPELQAS